MTHPAPHLLLAALLAFACALPAFAEALPKRLSVGVTLLPYYSWVATVADGAPVEVVPVLGPNADPHAYQGSPEDVKRLTGLDALVVNGLGHDDFVNAMLEAAGNKSLVIIKPGTGIPLIAYAGSKHSHDGGAEHAHPAGYNPHTFIALTSVIHQVLRIETALAKLAPAHAKTFRANALAYTRRLRKLKSDTLAALSRAGSRRVATVHDGYAYLLNELGLTQAAVIEPTHGTTPSAGELARTITAIRATGVKVVLSELNFPEKLVAVIKQETGASIHTLDHMGGGSFTKEQFEISMKANLDTIVKALTETR